MEFEHFVQKFIFLCKIKRGTHHFSKSKEKVINYDRLLDFKMIKYIERFEDYFCEVMVAHDQNRIALLNGIMHEYKINVNKERMYKKLYDYAIIPQSCTPGVRSFYIGLTMSHGYRGYDKHARNMVCRQYSKYFSPKFNPQIKIIKGFTIN